jgi:hypothetical protein
VVALRVLQDEGEFSNPFSVSELRFGVKDFLFKGVGIMKEIETTEIKVLNEKIEFFDLKLQNFKDSYKAGRLTQIQLTSMTKDFNKKKKNL